MVARTRTTDNGDDVTAGSKRDGDDNGDADDANDADDADLDEVNEDDDNVISYLS